MRIQNMKETQKEAIMDPQVALNDRNIRYIPRHMWMDVGHVIAYLGRQ